mmetsp:Transcript_5354/g.7718  ORF Transcript_5354/g.7718 Transcript_5354/m.7718 type:complete len:713 (+) Transcript_5354:104-2242(+)
MRIEVMNRVPSIGINSTDGDSETSSMGLGTFEYENLKRGAHHLQLGDSLEDRLRKNLKSFDFEHQLLGESEHTRNKRRRHDLLETANIRRRSTNCTQPQENGKSPPTEAISSGYADVLNLPLRGTISRNLNNGLSLLNEDLMLRSQIGDYAEASSMRLFGGNNIQQGASGNSSLASSAFSNGDLATAYLNGGHSNISQRLLALEDQLRLAAGHQSAHGVMNPMNANLESLLRGNMSQRGMDPALLGRDALLLRRQELANRLELQYRNSQSNFLNDGNHYSFLTAPLLRGGLTESSLMGGGRDSSGGRQMNLQSGLNQASLNPQLLHSGAPQAAPTTAQRFQRTGQDHGSNSTNESNSTCSLSPLYTSKPKTMKLSSEERSGIPPLPPCQEGPLPHFLQRLCVPLATDEDENWLSEFLCFIRAELVEVFRASNDDVASRINSKKVVYGQVGIRCRYCAHMSHAERASRSSSFPSSIDRIYQSLTMMIRDHFVRCTGLPGNLRAKFLELKSHTTQGATDSKRYWIESAKCLGMVHDHPNQGIMITKESRAEALASLRANTCKSSSGLNSNEKGRTKVMIVMNEDKPLVSEYIYYLLTQVEKVYLTQSERVGNRKSMELDMPGFGCKHCCASDRKGLCRFFPARRRTLPAKIKDLSDHLRRCTMCPMEVKEMLIQYRRENLDMEPTEDSNKHFFDRVWNRLHSEDKNCKGKVNNQ